MPSSAWSDPSRDLHSFPTRRSSDLDLVELLVRGIVGLVAGEQELAASDDHGEHVVEVVRDAAREPPDRFDLLELAHLVLALTQDLIDRKSTRLNSSHVSISYAVFCLVRPLPRSTLFPYTTLFRSRSGRAPGTRDRRVGSGRAGAGSVR